MFDHEISGLMKFHLNVADVVQKMRITAINSNAGALPISFVEKLLLSSKCNDLVITDHSPNTKITTEETERLLEVLFGNYFKYHLEFIIINTMNTKRQIVKFQLFHHSEKKMSLCITVETPLQASTIGEYFIDTTLDTPYGNMLNIEHQYFTE